MAPVIYTKIYADLENIGPSKNIGASKNIGGCRNLGEYQNLGGCQSLGGCQNLGASGKVGRDAEELPYYLLNGQIFGACQIFGVLLRLPNFHQSLAAKISAPRPKKTVKDKDGQAGLLFKTPPRASRPRPSWKSNARRAGDTSWYRPAGGGQGGRGVEYNL